MIRLAIVEDNDQALNTERKYLERFMQEHKVQIQVDVFRSGEQIVFSYEAVYDIILMDIEMPGIGGMAAAKKIRTLDPKVIIIFITNMAQYAIEGYKVRARAYILKPINYYGFSMELEEAVRSLDIRKNDMILVEKADGLVRIPARDILYVEVDKHMIMIHTVREVISIRSSMKKMEEMLSRMNFARSDVGFLINLTHVCGIENGFVVVENPTGTTVGRTVLPISRRKRKEFVARLTQYVSGNGPE
jgi:DNA-binding LytR/AlgR family response regulator